MDWSDIKIAIDRYKNKIVPKVGDILFGKTISKVIIHHYAKHRLSYGIITLEDGEKWRFGNIWNKIE